MHFIFVICLSWLYIKTNHPLKRLGSLLFWERFNIIFYPNLHNIFEINVSVKQWVSNLVNNVFKTIDAFSRQEYE